MKTDLKKPVKLTTTECLALGILQYALKLILESKHVVFTQVDLSTNERVEQQSVRSINKRIFKIDGYIADMTNPQPNKVGVSACVTLDKMTAPIRLWRPSEVVVCVSNHFAVKVNYILHLDRPTTVKEIELERFAANLNHEAYRGYELK